MRPPARRTWICVALASGLAAPQAAVAEEIDVQRIDPKAAVKGAAISVRGNTP